jgi:hypothetical protein
MIQLPSFFWNEINVVELPAEERFSFYCLLDDLVEFGYVFVHQGSCIVVEWLFEVGSFDVFQKVE